MTQHRLTKEDVAAIRTAESYVVHLNGDGTGSLHLTKTIKGKRGPFAESDREVTREIKIEAHQMLATFVDMYRAPQWRALGLIVRPGDRLIFEASENNSEPLTAAGFHNDELYVTVLRLAGKNNRDRGVVVAWPISNQISSSAIGRAIRPKTYELTKGA